MKSTRGKRIEELANQLLNGEVTFLVKNATGKEFVGAELVEITVEKRGGYWSFTGSQYVKEIFTPDDVHDYVRDTINEVLDVEYFYQNPDKTYEDVVEELSEPLRFVYEILGGDDKGAMEDNLGNLHVWRPHSSGQIGVLTEEERTPALQRLEEAWNEYHLKGIRNVDNNVENVALDIAEAILDVMEEVDQEIKDEVWGAYI